MADPDAPPPPSPVRVRFAPSPTGLLHIGGLRTALYNYLLARQTGGAFVLRIEDTDQSRFVPEAEQDILDALAWAGLAFDEGPGVGGPHAPYYQSQRTDRYREAARRLLEGGHAYYAFDTEEEIEAMRARRAAEGVAMPAYDAAVRGTMRNSLTLAPEETERLLAAGAPHVVRLRVSPGETVAFTDRVRGEVAFETDALDDQVLVKSDGLPTYHLANVVDDHEMGITHVIRGEEWLPSTPKHVLLYRALGWTPPQMAHLPLLLSPSGGKLSKRSADRLGIPVNVAQYREAGYEPAALVNFLAFLGWNPGTEQELFTLDELVAAFDLGRIGRAGVQFAVDKLNWYNGQFLRRLSVDALAERARPYVEAAGLPCDDETLRAAAALMQERLAFARDLATDGAFFFRDPETYDERGVARNWKPDSAPLLREYAARLEALEAFSEETAEAALRALAEECRVGAGRIIHPTRLAVSGVSGGPSLFAMLAALGRETVVRRLRAAAERLG
ncbi:MAG: glutamate--tRNA ligase [Rubricoccaceae bacterium]